MISLGVLVAGGAVWFFYSRSVNAVNPADVQTLQQYKVVAGSGASTSLTTTSAAADIASIASSLANSES